eukprot:3867204-Karenia_brevis.AAC.1
MGGTVLEANSYLDQFTIPFIWGGDFNRDPQQFGDQRFRNGPHNPEVVHLGARGAPGHLGGPISPHDPVVMTVSHRPFEIRTLQQVKLEKFQEASEEGLKLSWEDAKAY